MPCPPPLPSLPFTTTTTTATDPPPPPPPSLRSITTTCSSRATAIAAALPTSSAAARWEGKCGCPCRAAAGRRRGRSGSGRRRWGRGACRGRSPCGRRGSPARTAGSPSGRRASSCPPRSRRSSRSSAPPTRSRRGTRASPTSDEQETQRRLASTDAREIQKFYEQYCRRNLEEGHETKKPDEMARYYQIASVLYDVLKTVTPENSHSEFDQYAKGIEKEKASFSHYNILPLNISGPTQPVMEIPEIKAAVDLLRKIENLPMPRPEAGSLPEETSIVRDLLDWLWQTFGFQKGNVENQKEHLILLLANMDMREAGNGHQGERHSHMIRTTVIYLMKKKFQNYISWCRYLHVESNIKIPNDASTQQPELLYIGLYLLIWGEASNVRFMPECLCYIFHHMAKDLYDIISSREGSFDPPFQRDGSDDAFLQLVIQPIYSVIQNEAAMSKTW